MLAGQIGERNVATPSGLEQAREYIRMTWQEMGYQVETQKLLVHNIECLNLEVFRGEYQRDRELVIVGAHYDSVLGSPGANDNATGVAALLEISRHLSSLTSQSQLRFVAFVNEEPPFFDSNQMGSRFYARQLRREGKRVRAMLSLETMGFYREKKGSQHYPPFFSPFYPNAANFIAFVGNFKSRSLVRQAVEYFKQCSHFPVESACTPSFVPGVSWSDHGSFWREGYPAFMVTDTAFYRYPYYHTSQDTSDKIDYPKLTLVTEGVCHVVERLAEEL
jgi:Zn-dependent M28 family amino/carboxypeptidase